MMEQAPLRVGLIGYGAIGQDIFHLIEEQAQAEIIFVGALVRDLTKARPLGPPLVATFSELQALQPTIVVEVAGHQGLRSYGCTVLQSGIDLVFISIGALADAQFYREFLDAARKGGAQARIASGAIGGLDALSAASLGGFTKVVHTMRKPPHTLGRSMKQQTGPYEVFRGSAREAVLQYPEFLNIAAAVALASRGFDQTEVCVVADPHVEHSLHEVQAEGAFGALRFEIENAPVSRFPDRGARLVAMSIVHTLLLRCAPLAIG